MVTFCRHRELVDRRPIGAGVFAFFIFVNLSKDVEVSARLSIIEFAAVNFRLGL